MASASDIVAREFTIDDTNDDMYAAIDALRSEKDRLQTVFQAQQMGFDMQRKMQAGKSMQLKMIDNQVQLAEQSLRRLNTSYENKIKLLNRILDEKKVRDQALLEKGLEEVQTDVANLKVETSFLAGQINLLKKESEERKKEFDDQIADIRTKAADQNSWTEEIYSQVYTLQANSRILMAEYEEKQKNLREKEYIDSDPNTSAVYSTVFSKMNEVFIASKSIQSGMVSRAAYSKGDKAASYLTLAGSLIPFPAATAVLGYIAQGVQYLSDKREEDRINNVTGNALGFSEMDEICDWIARGIVFAYEEQIRALKTDSAKTFAECCVKYVLDFLATEDSERAVHLDEKSNATVVHVSSEDGTVTNVATIPAQEIASSPQETLVSDLLVYMSRRTGVKNGAYGLSDVKLETRIPGVTFTDRGIIKQTGLRTANGTFYHAPPPAPPGKTQKQSISPAERARQTLAKAVESPRTIAAGHPGVPASPLPTPPSGTPPDSPAPSMTRSRSFSKLFKWKSENPKELVKEASETAKGVVDLKETATKMAVNVALNAQEKFGAMLSGDEPCRPDIYGYRLGTVREAVLLGMIEVSKVHSKIIPLTPEQVARDPKAQSKFWTGK